MEERERKVKILEKEEARRRALREKKERSVQAKLYREARAKICETLTAEEEPTTVDELTLEEEEEAKELAKIPTEGTITLILISLLLTGKNNRTLPLTFDPLPLSPPFLDKCSGCGKRLGQFSASFGNRSWHPQCFSCTRCKGSLNNGFMEGSSQDKSLYCSHCHAEVFGEMCFGCTLPLGLQVKRAMNQNWHVQCFNCTNCKQNLDAKFVVKNEMPYCIACDEELFYEKCAGCAKSLIGR
jgi:hypothetical protein